MFVRFLATVLFTLALPLPAVAADAVDSLRVYALDCGRLQLPDQGLFADTGEYDGKAAEWADPCFLIRHPKGDLLWDTGVGDHYGPQGAVASFGIRFLAPKSLLGQLRELGLVPEDIEYLGFSHLHLDHTGNAGAFPKAMWLVNRGEVAWAEGAPMPGAVEPAHLRGRTQDRTQPLDFDHDVFGDGSVKILRTLGHTPGHQALQLQLPKSGTVILSGDLFHTRENFEQNRMPAFNHSPAETMASANRIRRILKVTGGRLIIQHDARDFAALPKIPAYLD